MKKLIGIVAATALAATIAAPAAAAPSNKGTTAIAPSEATVGIFRGVLRPSTGLEFGIVGNPAKGTIKHVGGIVVESSGLIEDENLKLRNFWIADGEVSGIVEGVGRAVLFEYPALAETVPAGACDGGVPLAFSATAAAVLGGDVEAGAYAGCATIDVKTPGRGR